LIYYFQNEEIIVDYVRKHKKAKKEKRQKKDKKKHKKKVSFSKFDFKQWNIFRGVIKARLQAIQEMLGSGMRHLWKSALQR
jgi:hypothetical protein